LVNKVEITPSRIITRNASGTTTFDTNNLYLKTDAGGSMYVGGFKRLPVYYGVMAVSTTNQTLPDWINYGYPETILSHSNFLGRVSGQESWYDMYIPDGVQSFYAFYGDNRGPSGPTIGISEYIWSNACAVQRRDSYTSGSWSSCGTIDIKGNVLIFLANQQYPVPGPRSFFPDPAQMLAKYQQYGAGYYRLTHLPSNHESLNASVYRTYSAQNGTYTAWTALTSTYRLGTEHVPTATNQYVQNGILVPAINTEPTNIDVAVTP
jgi:hypothetical protein